MINTLKTIRHLVYCSGAVTVKMGNGLILACYFYQLTEVISRSYLIKSSMPTMYDN
jgi:hypothetical protein